MPKYRCIDCGKEIEEVDVKHGGHRCASCDKKRFNYAIAGRRYVPRRHRMCPICGQSNVIIDEDNDMVACPYCRATWESVGSFNSESRKKKRGKS